MTSQEITDLIYKDAEDKESGTHLLELDGVQVQYHLRNKVTKGVRTHEIYEPDELEQKISVYYVALFDSDKDDYFTDVRLTDEVRALV
jgi:hypothetical protein